ncbi:hypothetical protein NIES4071_72980 [Calothrix sp. NIES-4071]|nr:hypothetical protein NIES4071_72980 [Calothrix sp. NIES-4071]BAZ61573.1 hypothetical protein NIES4105_72930 [Calothrix sp. NIES-4105]
MTVRQRHGCLTAWLIFAIISNSLGALANLYISANFNNFSSVFAQQNISNISSGSLIGLAVLSIFNIVCAVALLRWKKWGFYGLLATSVVAFILNLSFGINLVQSLLGFVGIAILYGVLNMGGENKAWHQLD